MQICRVFNFFIFHHIIMKCISQIHMNYIINFSTATSAGLNLLPQNPTWVGSVQIPNQCWPASTTLISLLSISAPPLPTMIQKQVRWFCGWVHEYSIFAWTSATHSGLCTFTREYGVTSLLWLQSATSRFPSAPPSRWGLQPCVSPWGSLPSAQQSGQIPLLH